MTADFSTAGHPRRWVILGVMCMSLVLVVAGVSSLNLALPSIRDALAPSNTELLWIVAAYALPSGRLVTDTAGNEPSWSASRCFLTGAGILAATAAAVWRLYPKGVADHETVIQATRSEHDS